MSIIIKGVNKPDSCTLCKVVHEADEYNKGVGIYGKCPYLDEDVKLPEGESDVLENCPIEQIIEESNKKKALVVAAYPGMGKSYYAEEASDRFDITDSDSSEFSWVKDENGNNTTKRNPDFPNNYINHIKNILYKKDIIFVSTHDVVRRALEKEGIDYVLIYPDKSLKYHMLERYEKRGNNISFVKFQLEHFDEFIDGIEKETFPLLYKIEDKFDYISTYLLELLEKDLEYHCKERDK